jgi:hypothetical protein
MNELVLRAVVYLAVGVVGIGIGWQIRDWKAGSDEASRLEVQQAQQDLARQVIASVADSTAKAVASIKITNTTIYQKTRHEIIKEPMDPGCRLPAGWMRNINAARAGANRSEPAAAVP